MLHNIIHISDIHIRTGDSNKSRYNEYINVFNNLYESIALQPSIINKSAVIVITGDIFHDKNKIGPSGIKIATYLLQKLSTLADIIIIRGNHDYRQDFPNEPDMISALISYKIPNVYYLDTSGIHIHKNISFGLVTIQETLLYGSTSGITNNLPNFPKPESSTNYKIAMFHGTINGTTLQNGLQTTLHGYPIEWFQNGYDAILLGDIHLQQVKRASIIDNTPSSLPHTTICQTYTYNKEIPWGYSGSLIQQDFGEPIKGHGYILWNLQDKIIHIYHIKNSVGLIKLHFNGNIDDIEVEHKQYIKPITKSAPLHKIITTKWFPDNLHIRVSGNNITSEDLRLITQKIQSYGKSVLSITKNTLSKTLQELTNSDKNSKETSDILDINSSDKLIQYIQTLITHENKTLKSNKWKQWLINPEILIIPTDNIPDTIVSKLQSKLSTIEKNIAKFNEEFDKVKTHQIITGKLTLNKLEWNWVLNYKNANVFDFDTNTQSISILNAQNGNGKSNFLEIICIALFGEGFPSRHNKNYSANIICDKKPNGVMASTKITFTLNNTLYILERSMRNNSLKRSIKFEDVILYNFTNDTKNIIHQKSVAVDKWVELNIGKCDTYLMSAMLSQNSDSDFFSLDHSEQKKLLDRVLSLEHINALQKLLKDTSTYYKTCADLIESYYDGVKSKTQVVDQKYITELNECQKELETLSQTKNDLYTKWNMVSDKSLSEIKNIHHLETTILNLQQKIKSCPTNNKNEIIQRIQTLISLINTRTNEIYKFHSFSDLDSKEIDQQYQFNSELIENTIAEYDLDLKQHPYFKKGEFSLYEPITHILSRIVDEFGFEDDNSIDTIKEFINNFETWNKIQIKKFAQDKKYFENNSEIENLQLKINSLIFTIQNNPNLISDLSKRIDKLKKQHKKITKEKDLCSDRRPNKPTKTNEWIQHTYQRIIQFGNLDSLLITKKQIQTSIQQIPILSIKIHNLVHKISEYLKYIKDCSEFPFNPDCNACHQQPWRTKYDSIFNELPILQNELQALEAELNSLHYSEISIPLSYTNYTSYLKDLDKEFNNICQNISEIELYNTESTSWINWEKWSTEYDTYKKQYDKLSSEINNLETQKRSLEISLERARFDKQQLQSNLETIQSKKHEYDEYLTQLQEQIVEYNLNKKKLEWYWYSTLYEYRSHINVYLAYKSFEKEQFEEEKKDLELVLTKILEKETYIKELEENTKLFLAYPHWIRWNELHLTEKSLNLKITELQVILKGDSIGKNLCDELLNNIKDDYDDITYIATAFNGYHSWLYSDTIGPIIQLRVNAVLELICEDRPLFLECEWLDTIDTLSWFIRDGSSRVIIQKASGFQRFIVGIAMRVAINQIGLSRVRYTELFIDEGFTACDSDNLERVPAFLRGLLRFYNSIYLATHLEDLKLCADKHIFIKRDDDGLSQIQYGATELIKEIATVATVAKKRGRPPKNSIIVSRV